MRRVLLASAVTLTVTMPACVPPEPEQTLERRYEVTTKMGMVQERGRVIVGVTPNDPPLGYIDPRTKRPAGLTVALGRALASTLGVRAELVTGSPEQLLDLVSSEEIDIAFPNIPLTEKVVRSHHFTDPYLIAHQRLLVPESSNVTGIDDLAGRKVCAAINSATGVSPDELEPTVKVTEADHVQDCVAPFRLRRVEAVTAADVYLHHLVDRLAKSRPAKVVGDQLSTHGYGAVLVAGGGWLPFLNEFLAASESDGTWTETYERWVGARPEGPPELSSEEAAALFPSPGQ